jgi:hypothetical protein
MSVKTRRVAIWAGITLAAALCAALAATTRLAASAPQVVQQGRPQQAAPSAPAPPPSGTSTITVTVVTDDGVAVKNARVAVVGVPGGTAATRGSVPGQAAVADLQIARDRGGRPAVVQKQLRTNSGGQATFTELPDGDYSVSVMAPAGYTSALREAPPRVQVKAGARAAATVKVTRGGVITGRVVDDEGDPVTGAYVQVFRTTKGGRPQSVGSGSQPSNDLGVYRVWSLAAGEYYVSTQYEDRQGPPDESFAQDGFLPSYFPGVAAFDSARPVQVKGGQETGGVDIQLVRGRLGSVTVRVVDSFGSAPGGTGPNANVNLVVRSRNPAYQGRGGGMRQDGTFHIPNVPAGDYCVSAMVVRGTGPTAIREGGYVPISVNGDEVSVSVQTNSGATISGRVVVEGVPPAQAGMPGSAARQPAMRVATRSASDGVYASAFSAGDMSGTSGTVRPDGTFTITGVRGPVQIAGSAARAAFKAARRGAVDVTGQPFELLGTERIDDVVVVMTYDTGAVQGTVVGESDEVLSNAAVLIVPEDPEKWSVGSPFIRLTRVTAGAPGGQGTAAAAMPGMTTAGQIPVDGGAAFQASLLPPGRYLVIGFADATTFGAQPDRQSIEAWRDSGTPVIVDVGQTAVVKIKAIR